MPHARLLATARMAAYLTVTLVLMPLQALLLASRMRGPAGCLPWLYHHLCRRIFGIRVVADGRISTVQPTLFVCNHVSYLDITVLGSLIRGSFVAKSDVATWPLFGWLARLQRTVFVDRQRRSAAGQESRLRTRLEAGDSLILFPEGTSSDGNRTLRFKSTLFQAAEIAVGGRPLTVQPVSIAYTRLDGIPIGRTWRPFFAWYGDMELAPHLWHVAGLGSMTVGVTFHPPVTLAEYGSRKHLSSHCNAVVAAGVATLVAGRGTGDPSAAEPEAAQGGTPVAESAH